MLRFSAKIDTSVTKVMRPQHRHRAEDREHADGQRQRRGQQAAEHPHQHHEAQRDRDGFHHQQVFFALPVDLDIGHRLAAGAHGDAVAVVHELVGQLLGVLLRAALPAGDARDDQPGLAVLADQRRCGGRRRGPRRGHLAPRTATPAAARRCRCRPRGRRRPARRRVGGHADHQLHVALAELVDQQLGRLRRLRRRVLEAAGGQALGDGDAEDAAGHHDKRRDGNDSSWRG